MTEDPVQERSKYLLFNVKPIWKVRAPSQRMRLPDEDPGLEFTIYGVDRGSMSISRNWRLVHSVEEYNQGFVASPPDLTITVAVKESGEAFEHLRRLGKTGTMFDVECDILRETDNPSDEALGLGYEPWLQGFEIFEGCVINREGQTIDVGAFPVREFEIMFLRHEIKEKDDTRLREGDGTYATYDFTIPEEE